MQLFKAFRDYFTFERAVRLQARYVRDAGSEAFLSTVRATAKRRIETISAGTFVWRAQIGHECVDDTEVPLPPARMKPFKDRAKEGRANPKGISYLYVATNLETALAEVRPWIGSLISVGRFKINRPLRVVNCTMLNAKGGRIYVGGGPSREELEGHVWWHIDRAFAEPVTPTDDLADYAPTQIIAELFKARGDIDGIAYGSSLGPGHNIALFDLDAADLINCSLFKVQSVKFTYDEAANPYTVEDTGGKGIKL